MEKEADCLAEQSMSDDTLEPCIERARKSVVLRTVSRRLFRVAVE